MAAFSVRLGDVLSGRFEVRERLGEGGMGAVYGAYDSHVREIVALKLLRPELAGRADLQARLRREIRLARAITHPNVCRVHDLFTHLAEDGTEIWFLSMEYLRGEPLSHRLAAQGRLAPPLARRLFEHMAGGLDAAHRRGIVHRDFKPGNVMLVPDNDDVRAVITDFGVAVRADADQTTETALTGDGRPGTVPYMAPEQISGGPVGPYTDIYALGLVTFEMLTGRRAWQGSGPPPLGFTPPRVSTIAPDVDDAWDAIVRQCLSEQPARRFASALDAVSTLTGEDARPRPGRFRLPAAIALLVILVIGSGIAAVMLSRRSSERPDTMAAQFYETGVRALREGAAYKASAALQRAAELDPGDPLAHARLAEAALELDHLERAEHEILLAGQARETRQVGATEALRIGAIRATAMRQYAEAVTLYEQLANAVPASERAAALVDLGRAQERAGRSQEALATYARAAKDSAMAYPAAHLRLGVLHARLQQPEQAANQFAEAEQLYTSLGEAEGVIEVMYQRGLALNRREEFGPAAAILRDGLARAQANRNPYQEIRILFQLSTSAYLSGNGEEGRARAEEALTLARKNGVENLVTRALLEMGNSSQRMGRRTDAQQFFEEARQLAGRYRLRRDEARARLSLASLKTEIGKPAEALGDAQAAVTYYEQAGFRREVALAQMIMGRAARQLGDYAKATQAFTAQLESARQLNDAALMDYAYEGLASVLYVQQRYPQALEYLRHDLQLREKHGSGPDIADANVNVAEALISLGALTEAERHLAAARARLARERGSNAGNRLLQSEARLALVRGRTARARALAGDALVAAQRDADASAVHALRVIEGLASIRSDEVAPGRKLCEEVVTAARQAGDKALLMVSELCVAEAVFAAGDYVDARGRFRRIVDQSRELTFLESEWLGELLAAKACRMMRDSAAAVEHTNNAQQVEVRLRALWGEEFLRSYTRRPDIQKLTRT